MQMLSEISPVMAESMTEAEEEIVKEFMAIVRELQIHNNGGKKSWNQSTAIKFMMARKFDICRAIALFESHEVMRRREGLVRFDPGSAVLRRELETGKFTVLPMRDSTGAAIAVFTANKHHPLETTHQVTLQGVIYQLDVALESLETQRKGIVFIYNMTGSRYTNFDYELSQKILNLLKGGYPARLKKVLIVAAPLWFKAPFRIFQLFLREKLRDRVFMVSIPQLCMHIPNASLPRELGGSFCVDHREWLQYCLKSTANREALRETAEETDSVHEKQNSEEREKEVEVIKVNEVQDCSLKDEEPCPLTPESASTNFTEEEDNNLETDDKSSFETPKWDPSNQDVGMTLEEFIASLRAKGRKGLYQEYAALKAAAPTGTFETSRLKPNQTKNRYTDVLCYDHSRVKLPTINNDPYSDYINANFVDGYKQKNAFISTQGPLPWTFEDFWRMIWDQETHVIVMTTKIVERARTKCGQYWPQNINSIVECGDFEIYNKGMESFTDYIVTNLILTNKKEETSQDVVHMLYVSWPDYGVPTSAFAMLDFRERVRERQTACLTSIGEHWKGHPRGPPILVHCSAGIGRTGTFITLDVSIDRLKDQGTIDILGTVEKIRGQRAHSIQMPDQYVFCHLALLEYALSRGFLQDVDLSGFNDDSDQDSSSE